MPESRSLLLRLGASLALFDIVQTYLGPGDPIEGFAVTLTAICMPFGFYGLVFLALRRMLKDKFANVVGIMLLVLRHGFFMVPMFIVRDAEPPILRYGIGLAVTLAVIFLPWKSIDKAWRVLCPGALLPGALGIFLLISGEETAKVLPAPSAKAAQGSPNIVLISWDTVRADVLPMYGGTDLEMPTLSAFAERSLIFEDAVAITPITGPEHASMLTGVYPPSHGLRANMLGMAKDGAPSIATHLRDHGYRTGGFIAAFPLVARFGFGQGFERFDDRLLENPLLRLRRFRFADAGWVNGFYPFIPHAPTAYSEGPMVQQRATEWLEGIPQEDPYFLFLHLYDAHAPYRPTEPYLSAALEKKGQAQPPAFDPADADAMARYRGEIAMLDDYLAEILGVLEARDPGLKNTLVLLTADHGECFGEGEIYHDHVPSLYEATQHVPMILHLPGGVGAGTRVSETVAHLDIVPTFLAAAGLERTSALDDVESYPLQGFLQSGFGSKERIIYMEAQQFKLGKARKQGWRTQDWKMVQWDGGHQDLWRYHDDEAQNFAAEQPGQVEKLLTAMQDFFEALPKATGDVVEMSAKDMNQMGQLGYTEDVDPEEE